MSFTKREVCRFSNEWKDALNNLCTNSTHYLVKARHEFVNKEYNQAVNDLRIAAQYKEPQALYALGYMYYYGLGVESDPLIARIYLQQAAHLYFPPAMDAILLLQRSETVGFNAAQTAAKTHQAMSQKTGFIDLIVERSELKRKIGSILSILLKKNSDIHLKNLNETSETNIQTREAS